MIESSDPELTVSDITENSAIISWSSDVNATELKINGHGNLPTQSIFISRKNGQQLVSDLEPGTTYTVGIVGHVYVVCILYVCNVAYLTEKFSKLITESWDYVSG